MIHTLVTFHVQAGQAAAFESVHRKLVEAMGGEPGCIEIKVHRSLTNPLEYMVYGSWESKEAWERAHQTSGFKELFKNLPVVEHTLSKASFFEPMYAAEGRGNQKKE